MDLDLSDEQVLLSESVDTMLARTPKEPGLEGAGVVRGLRHRRQRRARCGRAVPGVPRARAPSGFRAVLGWRGPALRAGRASRRGGAAKCFVALAVVERGHGWNVTDPAAIITADGRRLDGAKLAVEHAEVVEQFAVVATREAVATVAIVPRAAPGVSTSERTAVDPTLPMYAVEFDGVDLEGADVIDNRVGRGAVDRLPAIGALLAAAESVGAASRMLDDACAYAAERRQFGHPIGSFQALRHLLADMYVRQSSAWSTVLYAAATLDLDSEEAAQTASIAKAYVARATREVAHGAMQVFGGIAFTAEHQAHRFLRRILVRNQQFGDAAHHEQALGRQLAARFATAAA